MTKDNLGFLKNWSKRESVLLVILIPTILSFGLCLYASSITQNMYINSLESQKLQLERLTELAPNEWWWSDSLKFVNWQLEQMRTTK